MPPSLRAAPSLRSEQRSDLDGSELHRLFDRVVDFELVGEIDLLHGEGEGRVGAAHARDGRLARRGRAREGKGR